MKNIEILAPVGSMEALYAAVQNGAHAVYLGGKLFNARHYASNFDYTELKDAVTYAHLNNVKIYVTVNILIDNGEFDEIIDYIRFLYDIDVDAIIVQDLGLASLVRRIFPSLAIHGSTQMTINNLWGAQYLESMGFTRAILARETPISEIKKIREQSSIELEGFVHGALCVSYSGQCMMSSMIGGRSGNRGMCAQPCRMNYSIVNLEGKLLNGWDKKYILSTRDLNTIDYIDEIINSGISSLKIEGRMKRPEYVATIVKNYREALDKGIQAIGEDSKKDIEQIFNRSFTKGVGLGDFGRSYISLDRPDNRGLLLGKVIRADKYKVYVKLEEELNKDDGIEFILSNGQYKGMKSPINGARGETISLEKPGYISKDSLVYRTSSKELLDKARNSYEDNKKTYPIDMEVVIKVNQKPRLKVVHKELELLVELDGLVEEAKNLPLDKTRLLEQLSKLGDTFYHINKFDADLDDNAFLTLSSLNELRRLAVEGLDKRLKNHNNREEINEEKFSELKELLQEPYVKNTQGNGGAKRLHIKVETQEQFNQLDLKKLDRLYIGFVENLESNLLKVKKVCKEAYIWTGKILYEADLLKLEDIIRPHVDLIDGIAVSNLGSFYFFKNKFKLKIHGDIGLNIFNIHSANHLKLQGLASMSLSPELNLKQIDDITKKSDFRFESLVYGYLTLMTTKTCPMALVKGCVDDSQCKSCNLARGYGLKDRMNMVFNMVRGEGYTSIYNSVPIMVLDNLQRIVEAGIRDLRLDFSFERDNVGEIQGIYYDYLNKLATSGEVEEFIDDIKKRTNITNGHYFRGIM